jgi:hypothetical protein
MAPFRFRLERVLQWQVKVCHFEEEKVRECLLVVSETAEKLARLKADSLGIEQELLNHRAFTATDLKARAEFRTQVVKDERALIALKQAQTRDLEAQRQKLLAERHQLRLLEKIRERALQEHRTMADRELEASALDCHIFQRNFPANRVC